MRPRKPVRRASLPASVSAEIEKFSHDGRGLARIDGRVLLVENAVPGEQCEVKLVKGNSRLWQGIAQRRQNDGPVRVEPSCADYGHCGGCQLQHVAHEAQVRLKQAAVSDHFQRNKVMPKAWAEPLTAQPYEYRHRARLHVTAAGQLGFHQAGAHRVSVFQHCRVLLPALQAMVERLRSAPLRGVQQVEIAVDDQAVPALAVVKARPETAHALLVWAQALGWQIQNPLRYLAGAQTVYAYPGGFTQVNRAINRAMLQQASDWLALQAQDRLLDLFCGNGNISLALAPSVHSVVGFEAGDAAVELANQAARESGLSAHFYEQDLFAQTPLDQQFLQDFAPTCAVLDPPRAGALSVCQALDHLTSLKRLLYISCDPATLARDLQELGQRHWCVVKAGLLDMFPQTRHIETMVLLEQH